MFLMAWRTEQISARLVLKSYTRVFKLFHLVPDGAQRCDLLKHVTANCGFSSFQS